MKSTFGRLFTSTVLVLLTAILILGASFRTLVRNYLVDNAAQKLRSDAQVVADLASVYRENGSLSNLNFLTNLAVASRVSEADAVICSASGKILLCSDAPLGCQHQGMSLNSAFVQKVMQDGESFSSGVVQNLYTERRYMVAMPIPDQSGSGNIGLVLVSMPTAATQAVLQKITDIFLFLSGVVVLATLVITALFTRRQSKPLQQMCQAATAFGHGDLNARVQLNGEYTRDVEELAIAFNNMASSLQKSEYQRQEFVANVSHELKTPMTTISGYIDGILDGTIPQEKRSHYLRIVSDETKRLSRLVRSMLDISRLQDQGGIPEEKKSRFDLEECAGQVLITFEQKILDKQLNVNVDMPEHPVYTRASKDSVTQVIYNLIDNAVKFSPQGGELGLRMVEGGGKVYVSVSNQGDTIPPEELPLVFDRFHKTDKSRSQDRDGWGLGLYIVKTLVCSHGENISVTSRDGRTEFTFTMPLVV